MKKIITLLLLLGSFTLFAQNRYYVSPNGNDANYGISWNNAFRTLQKALSAAVSGTEIWVAAGTYYPDEGPGQTDNSRGSYFSLRSGVAVYGGFGGFEYNLSQRDLIRRETILSGDLLQNDGSGFSNNADNAYHVVYSNSDNSATILDGFTITGGNASTFNVGDGGGMRNDDSNPTVLNCIFTGNWAFYYGGGLYNKNSSPTLINCQFIGNYADQEGGGLYNQASSNAKIINCSFTRNHGRVDGGAIFNQNSDPTIVNCTIAWNAVGTEGGGICNAYSHPKVYNSIIWGNSYAEISNTLFSSTSVAYSIVQGGYSGTGNLAADPLFTAGLHLQGCSPAINSGDDATANLYTTTDGDGATRTMLGRVDMGAYEVQQAGIGGIIYVNARAHAGGDGSSWARAYNKLQDALAQAPLCNLPTQVWVAGGTYYPDEGVGRTDNDRTASFSLKNNVTLYGDFAGTERVFAQRTQTMDTTILSGDLLHNDGTGFTNNADNAYHVVTANGVNGTAVLDGFYIRGGNANGPGGQNLGGGMYNVSSTPSLVQCIFENNSAGNGGGLYNQAASPTLSYCRFTGNSASFGGGVYNQSTTVASNCNPVFSGCWLVNNTAKQEGGGMYNYSSSGTLVNSLFWLNLATTGAGMLNQFTTNLRLTNCTFGLNRASNAGGALYNANTWDSRPTLTNSILWGDMGGEIAGGEATVTYSLVQLSAGVYPGTNNINADPLFNPSPYWDPHLRPGSPAINAGDNAAVAGIPYDGSGPGYARIYADQVDMGAFEWRLSMGPGEWESKPLTLLCPRNLTLYTTDACGINIDFDQIQPAAVDGGQLPVMVTYTLASGNPLPPGTHTITVMASDGAEDTLTCSFTLTVVDTSAPVIGPVTVSAPVLYPPNHKMQEVDVNYNVTDNCTVTTTLSVTSNEPVYTAGSGDTGPDWQVLDNHHLQLRAERSGRGSDRVYTITITARDASGNTSKDSTTVTVPHDNAPVTMNAPAGDRKEATGLVVTAVPNPFTGSFTFTLQSPAGQPLDLRVIDAAGRVVESRKGVAANGVLHLGTAYHPGVYYVQVMQGSATQTIKVVKQAQ